MITCKNCDAVWTGENRCHCPKCHITLAGVTYWNKHRVNGRCIAPEKLGLVLNDKQIWSAAEEA